MGCAVEVVRDFQPEPNGTSSAMEQADLKYVVVNGDEGDPGAYMDRTVMEDNPHRVLEGMMIAAYAIGAQHWLSLHTR